jgi:hypothetical protein
MTFIEGRRVVLLKKDIHICVSSVFYFWIVKVRTKWFNFGTVVLTFCCVNLLPTMSNSTWTSEKWDPSNPPEISWIGGAVEWSIVTVFVSAIGCLLSPLLFFAIYQKVSVRYM